VVASEDLYLDEASVVVPPGLLDILDSGSHRVGKALLEALATLGRLLSGLQLLADLTAKICHVQQQGDTNGLRHVA
jgi:hypothetical protein